MTEKINNNTLSLFDVQIQMDQPELEYAKSLIAAMDRSYKKNNHRALKMFISKFIGRYLSSHVKAWAKYHFVPDDRYYVEQSLNALLDFLGTGNSDAMPDDLLVSLETISFGISQILGNILRDPSGDFDVKTLIATFVELSKDDIPYSAGVTGRAHLALLGHVEV